jgi:oxygen-independent coproporphyrinogen-3 oxidase
MKPDRMALFGYAHVPHVIPRQRRIDAAALPGQRARFAMAAQGSAQLRAAGYETIGFDHFALPHDAMARARHAGTLRRNFQGFTDDAAPVLVGLGASSVSQWPGLLVQNEKNAGRYREAIEAGRLPGTRGVVQTAEDQRRAALIEALLCQEAVDLPADIREAIAPDLAPFIVRGLARLEGGGWNSCPAASPITARSRSCSTPIADKAISSARPSDKDFLSEEIAMRSPARRVHNAQLSR